MSVRKVLIVEDQSDIRMLIRLSLEMHGTAMGASLEIHEALNGAQGIEQARKLKPDVVLLDVMMPGEIDGYDACRLIKSDETLKSINVVLLTARGQTADMQRGVDAGADAYIVKPFRPKDLVVRILEIS